ncbi:MAG: class I SAM-dependent methyltransferase [Bacteroidetes bacterium]|nr:MAG: class I SAM-dependent methyltransferase [Bacteroidota bacterium]
MDKTKKAVAVFEEYASVYQDKFMDQQVYADTFDLFCALVTTENPAVLELACGPGNITKYLLDKRPDLRILGTDLSPAMLELAQANNPSATFKQLDCRDAGTCSGPFDAVVFGFGLPYISREEAADLIRDVAGILTPGGIFYLSTMEGDYEKSGWEGPSSGEGPKAFIHYHEADYLTNTLQESGFSIQLLSRKPIPPELRRQAMADLILIARKEGPGTTRSV